LRDSKLAHTRYFLLSHQSKQNIQSKTSTANASENGHKRAVDATSWQLHPGLLFLQRSRCPDAKIPCENSSAFYFEQEFFGSLLLFTLTMPIPAFLGDTWTSWLSHFVAVIMVRVRPLLQRVAAF
jgi:hypothetical protein